jgi:hypothetical protein
VGAGMAACGGLLSFFAHRITNAAAEGLNSRIQAIRVSARGYRNREHFKTAIYFHCGGLALYPQASYTQKLWMRMKKKAAYLPG